MIENSLEKQLLKQELEEVKSNIERIILSYRRTLQIKDITTNIFYGVTHCLISGGRQQPHP